MDFLPKDPAILVSSVNMLLRDEEFDTLEALCFAFSRDDIELAIGNYVDDMSQELYDAISDSRPDFLRDHKRFGEDITQAVERLEKML